MASKTKEGEEWEQFSDIVLKHIETYTVPQYGDKGDSNIDNWSAKDCVLAISKYIYIASDVTLENIKIT